MSLLSYNELCELVEQGVITHVEHDQINAASIDITVGETFLLERNAEFEQDVLVWREREKVPMFETKGSVVLNPGEFCLAQTQQVFNLPNDIAAIYVLKSSMARSGLNHLNAGYCDPGWNGSVLTLELVNHLHHHRWLIREGDPIGQMYFHRVTPVPADRSYAVRGRYNGDTAVSRIKA
jgi:dCTP deaminase